MQKQLTILDLSEGMSGPYCTRLFAGWGAKVIKIEQREKGDGARGAGPFPDGISNPEKSALFLYLNTGKESVTLDITQPKGKELLARLVKDADVLVENSAPGVMTKLGLDYASVSKINPRIVMTSVTPFGQTGLYSHHKATPFIEYAMGGQMWVCGEANREPLNCGLPVCEYFAGLYAFIGTMMALEEREKSGKGQLVDVATLECMVASHQFTITWPAYSDSLLVRPGWPGFRAPASFYKCIDGYVNLRLQGIEITLLAFLFNMPELTADERFADVAARIVHIKELEEIVVEKLAKMKKKDVFRTAGEWRALCGYVATSEDLLNDPQYAERQFWDSIEHPAAGTLRYPGAPVKMTASKWVTKPAPLLGEHNKDIICDLLGYSNEELVQLKNSGVV